MIDTDAIERVYTRVNAMRNDIKSTIDHTKTIVEQEATSLKQTQQSLEQVERTLSILNIIENLINRNNTLMMKIEGQSDNHAERMAFLTERVIDRFDKAIIHSQEIRHDVKTMATLKTWFKVLCFVLGSLVISNIGLIVWMVKR